MQEKNNMDIFNRARNCPESAQTPITTGKLAELGYSDINPVWRYERLTEIFGPVGTGWRYRILKMWMEAAGTGEVVAFVNVALSYRREDGSWSEEFEGTGGAFFVGYEENTLCIKKDCYKAALTDALSVACKPIGIAADVYYNKNRTNNPTAPAGEDGNDTDLPFTFGTTSATTEGNSNYIDPRYTSTAQAQSSFAMPPQTQPQPNQGMSKDEALNFVVQIGAYKNNPKTVREVIFSDKRSTDFYTSDKFQPNYAYGVQLKNAFRIAMTS